MKKNVFIFVMLGLLSGCATLSNEVSLSKMLPRQRVYVGKILVDFRASGKKVEPSRCEIYVNADLAPSIKLANDGRVVYKTDRSEFRFRKIACYHKESARAVAWHLSPLPLSALTRPEGGNEVVYFGDITLSWDIDSQATIAAAAKERAAGRADQEGRVEDSGELRVSVASDLQSSEEWLKATQPLVVERAYTFKENLMKVQAQ